MFEWEAVPYSALMLYSYRHPDFAAEVAGSSAPPKAVGCWTVGLEERRLFVRSIPVAAVIDGNDADAWSLWDQAVENMSLLDEVQVAAL